MPARYLFMDEIDGYPQDIDGEGDPILLAERRTATFSKRKKIFLVSTPTIKGLSNIEREFENSDKRYYFVPCPYCGGFQKLEWAQIRAEDGKAQYECVHCGKLIGEHYKTQMVGERSLASDRAKRWLDGGIPSFLALLPCGVALMERVR